MEAELQREVEELKLRLHMAAEHYKEKYRECQRLRRQVAKLTSGEGVSAGWWRRWAELVQVHSLTKLLCSCAGGQEERLH